MPTTAELREQIEDYRLETKRLEGQLATVKEENVKLREMGNFDISSYNHKIKTQEAEIEKLKSALRSEKENRHREQQERLSIDKDKAKADEIEQMPWQTSFAAFKVLPRGINRDLWNDSGRPVFDTGVDLENFTGVVYLPVQKVVEMGRSIGMLTKDDSDQLIAMYEKEKAKNEFAATEAKELINGISKFVHRFDSNLADFVVPTLEQDADGFGSLESAVETSGESEQTGGQNDLDHSGEGSDGVSSTPHDSERGIFGDLPDL